MIFIENGKKRIGEEFQCEQCFCISIRRVNQKTVKKFCSIKCAARFVQAKKEKVSCDLCGELFCTRPSRKNRTKHGFHFCSRKCKEKAQSLTTSQQDTERFSPLRPGHYGSGKSGYRKKAFESLDPRCEDCGLDFIPVLTVHHRDGDRKNNKLTNLAVLCWNHHVLRHLKKVEAHGEVSWVRENGFITQEEDVVFLKERIKGPWLSHEDA